MKVDHSVYVFLLTLWYLIPVAVQGSPPRNHLKRHNITNYKKLGAICNDGSPGMYYLDKQKSDKKWLIFIEGGGSCTSPDGDCIERSKATPYYTSSNYYPDHIVPKTIMADEMFDDYNKALLVQCSSDLWLGNSSEAFNISSASRIAFRGAVIFQSVMKELIMLGMGNASEVYMAGRSAGGIGIANQLKHLQAMLPSNTRIYATLDSSWFINYDNFINRSSAETLKSSGVSKIASCMDRSWGFPCCISIACMISRSYIPENIQILLLISKYDIYSLFNRFINRNTSFENILDSKDILLTVHSYGGRMEQTLQILNSKPNISYALSTCFHHGYLVSSNLWNLLYNTVLSLTFSSVSFRHVVNESLWNEVHIGGNSIRNIILNWKNRVSDNNNNNTNNQLHHLVDDCLHANCNPTCPKVAFFDDFKAKQNFLAELTLIVVVVLIIIFCLVTKFYLLVHNQYKSTAQLSYLKKVYSYSFEETSGIPPCPSQEAIGISCYNLVKKSPEGLSFNGNFHLSNTTKFDSLNGISAYFNPGQLVGLMGPKSSGKTTLLSLLTARNAIEDTESNLFINGIQLEEIREWFARNSGYVQQDTTSYYEELTVRQNLTYSAMMRLPVKMSDEEKMLRIEQVIGQCDLHDVADTIVRNSATGCGLTNGQIQQLCIGLQLLDLPNVIFLDEPITGLDITQSLEILQILHGLTLSGRLVIATIHEPRFEIFHLFDSILFLCNGQVGYHGSPVMMPHMFADALEKTEQRFDATHPSDSIVGVLMNSSSQKRIVDHYAKTGETQAINLSIDQAKRHPYRTPSMQFQRETSSLNNRLCAMEGRTSAAETISQMFYLPVVFALYVLALATSYYQAKQGIMLMSCYMVFACASQLFMSSVIHAHLHKALTLFTQEKADGVSYSTELVLHVFIRTFSKSFFPLFCSCIIIYLCTVQEYVLWKFCLTTLIHLQLNQVWIAIIIFTACTIPRYSHLVTPILSACAGFAGGFLIPASQMPSIFSWMFYINPTQWAYSGMMKVLLHDVKFDCQLDPAPLECLDQIGILILQAFGFNERNPYMSMLVLLIMLVIFLILSVIMLELKYSKRKWWQFMKQRNASCKSDSKEMENGNIKDIKNSHKAGTKHITTSHAFNNDGYITDTSDYKGEDTYSDASFNDSKEVQDTTVWENVSYGYETSCSSYSSNDELDLNSPYDHGIVINIERSDNENTVKDVNGNDENSLSKLQNVQIPNHGYTSEVDLADNVDSKNEWSRYLHPSPKCHHVHCSLNVMTSLQSRENRRGVKKNLLRKVESHQLKAKSQSAILHERKIRLRSQLHTLQSRSNELSDDEDDRLSVPHRRKFQSPISQKRFLQNKSFHVEKEKTLIQTSSFEVETPGVSSSTQPYEAPMKNIVSVMKTKC